MRQVTYTTFICEHCTREYGTKEFANLCERSHGRMWHCKNVFAKWTATIRESGSAAKVKKACGQLIADLKAAGALASALRKTRQRLKTEGYITTPKKTKKGKSLGPKATIKRPKR